MRLFKRSSAILIKAATDPNTGSITKKLIGLLIGLLVGFLIIGLAYHQVLEENKKALAVSEKISKFEIGIHDVQSYLLNAKKSESDFYLKKYPVFLGKFDTNIIVASQTLKDLTKLVKDESELSVVTKLGDSFEAYRQSFINAADSQIEIGLNEDTGLASKLIGIKNSIQKNIEQHSLLPLEQSLLKIRQYEAIYTQKEDNKYNALVKSEITNFESKLAASKLAANDKSSLTSLIQEYRKTYLTHSNLVSLLNQQKQEVKLAAKNIEPLFEELLLNSNMIINNARHDAADRREKITIFFIFTLVITAFIVSAGLFILTKNVVTSLKKLQETVLRVNEGDFTARAHLNRKDELGKLSNAFDKLLDERLTNMALSEKETEKLNESVIELIKAVSRVAKEKNLAVKIPVSEDITGAIGDSLNLLIKETVKILLEVKTTSNKVASVSTIVKQQSDRVISVANEERKEVMATTDMLEKSVHAMNVISKDAQDANIQAEKTIVHTQKALDTVLSSVDGINSIRNMISETEKRIKRLGERSQEISGIVSLINSIAERTHILALNASMHAASAGEAGRGFAVVADEVQRLAENAREATSEISTVVNNIRVETADTVMTMNRVISQVADGTKLAEQAGLSMKETQQATNDLVRSVQHIASSSVDQAHINTQLLARARQIHESTEQTGREMKEQSMSTDALVNYSNELVTIVSVFNLPDVKTVDSNSNEYDDDFTITAKVKRAI